MIARVLWAGVIAGLIAGCASTVMHLTHTVPLIAVGERYETAAMDHHAAALARAADSPSAHSAHEEWEPTGFARPAFTALFDVLAGVGYGLLLVAGMMLAGRRLDLQTGLLWGLAGFAAFAAAPALGLPPELPGMPAAALAARQAWWLGTAAATAAGLAVIAFAPLRLKALGILLGLVPHVIGAPSLSAGNEGAGVPAEVAAHFVAASLVSALVFWVVLGAAAAHLLGKRATLGS